MTRFWCALKVIWAGLICRT